MDNLGESSMGVLLGSGSKDSGEKRTTGSQLTVTREVTLVSVSGTRHIIMPQGKLRNIYLLLFVWLMRQHFRKKIIVALQALR